MNLESQVTSLELSKRLCELGIKQESLYYWRIGVYPHGENYQKPFIQSKEVSELFRDDVNACSAFTASELLELLPHEISKNGIKYSYLVIIKKNHEYEIRYNNLRLDDTHYIEFGHQFVDALAKTLIHIKETKLC